jgi:SpoVK/Ycf46/Vps4 family AAA+-type ATPase
MKLDDAIADFLLGGDGIDTQLSTVCAFVEPETGLDELPLTESQRMALRGLVHTSVEEHQPLRLYLQGQSGAGQHQVAHALAHELRTSLMTVDLALALVADSGLRWVPQRIFRQQRLLGFVLYIEGYDQLANIEWRAARLRLQEALAQSLGTTLVSGDIAWQVEGPEFVDVFNMTMPLPAYVEGRAWWNRVLNQTGLHINTDGLDQLAGRFRLSPLQISQTVQTARMSAKWQTAESSKDASEQAPILDDLFSAARLQSKVNMNGLANKIESRYHWNDIVLPEDSLAQLHEICQQVIYRHRVMDEWGFDHKLSLGKGVTALFAGPSGTGKTMAAEIIANELKLDSYRIDLSGVVSKYIGETEKNLDRIFTAAANANAILFFDEADALFGKRSEVHDAHDRYANIEISYLLQKMETYEGLAILATNLRQNMDESFIRRLTFTVHFPFPDETNRLLIWKGVWPSQTPLASDLNLDYLARQFKLSGGNIKNVALASAFLACVDGGEINMEHILHAIRREYQKLGKNLTNAELYESLKEYAR